MVCWKVISSADNIIRSNMLDASQLVSRISKFNSPELYKLSRPQLDETRLLLCRFCALTIPEVIWSVI